MASSSSPFRLAVIIAGKNAIRTRNNYKGPRWLNEIISSTTLGPRQISTILQLRKPRFDVANFERLGNTAGTSAGASPYQLASVAAY